MGEHKRGRTRSEIEAIASSLTTAATDKGEIVALGAAAFLKIVLPPDCPPAQIRDMRMAFIAGADFLFASIMNVMEAGTEPTAKDLERMSRIHDELERFRKEFTTRHPAPERPQ
jgi:hypothetical protein